MGRFGIYQAALVILIGGCMIAFAVIWRVSAAETLASMFTIVAGASIALLALDLEYNASNVIAVINPLERMLTFADASTTDAANGSGLFGIPLLLFDGVASVLARYTFVLHSSPRPTVFLTWLIVPGIMYAWRRGEKRTAIQALALLLAAIGVDALGVRRGLKSEYFIFTDPLIVLAGAILLDSLRDLRFHKWAYPVAAVLFGLHIAVGQAEPIKYAFKRSGPESICEWNRHYVPLLPLPWCPFPPVRS
jgi:glutaredoxin-related protein